MKKMKKHNFILNFFLVFQWPQRSVSTIAEPTFNQDNPTINQDNPAFNPDNPTFNPAYPHSSFRPDPDIYEPIYDSRWRLLNQVSFVFFRVVPFPGNGTLVNELILVNYLWFSLSSFLFTIAM